MTDEQRRGRVRAHMFRGCVCWTYTKLMKGSLDRRWNTAQIQLTLSLLRDSIDVEGG